jgi:transcription elongation factor GreA
VSAQDRPGEAISAEGLKELRAELERLEGEARREMAKRILAARELGDLKENAEYHIAKEDQAHLETRISRLAERLRNAVVTETDTGSRVVGFGSTVHVVDGSGTARTFTLVGPTEADLREGRLSIESPMAQALMGRAPGDDVQVSTPRGRQTYRIERLGA